MSNIIVIGAGMVGSAMAVDLVQKHNVTLADLDAQRLQQLRTKFPAIEVMPLDVQDAEALQKAVINFDLVICAVPGFLGYLALKHIIEAGKNVVDISFSPENALDLDGLAKKKKVTVIVDCGVAPGMDNIILGHCNEEFQLTHFECLVGGLPKVKKWPFYYKAPFSPIDVIEEYTRPARYVENGEVITRAPLTDCEYISFDKVGTLESFNTDGLRSILFTMSHIPNMKEKTLRYPGHIDYIKALKETGFFNTEKIKVHGVAVSPLAFTSRILIDDWKLGDTDEEITVMRVTCRGLKQSGEKVKVEYNLYDEYNPVTQTSSMARTTGYTATAAANMVLDGVFTEKGLFPPELVGKHQACYDYILKYLEERGIHYVRTMTIEK